MKSVRVQPADKTTLLVDVVCDCGGNWLANKANGEASFKHPIELGSGETILVCGHCQNEYSIQAQNDHIHVSNKS